MPRKRRALFFRKKGASGGEEYRFAPCGVKGTFTEKEKVLGIEETDCTTF